MRAANGAVIALLATGEYVRAELWTITLNGGTVIRWHNLDRPLGTITYGGHTWLKGPGIRRGAISEKVGVEVATLSVDLISLPSDLINGKPIIPFIAAHGLDGASVKLERAYAQDMPSLFGDPGTPGVAGTSIRFSGKITGVNSIQGAVASFTISSWMVLLNADMPRNLYQAACMHSLYDSGCGLSAATFAQSGHFAGGWGANVPLVAISLTPTLDCSLGRLVVTSGANNGLSRSIKTDFRNGNILFTRPFPNAIANGDTLTIYPGCDLTRPTCLNKFANLNSYKGTDFVPIPTTPLTIPASSTTTTSGKGGDA